MPHQDIFVKYIHLDIYLDLSGSILESKWFQGNHLKTNQHQQSTCHHTGYFQIFLSRNFHQQERQSELPKKKYF